MATQNIVSYSKDMINNPGNIRKIVFNAGIESSLEYAEPQRNKAPKIQLLFSPFGLPFIPLEIVGSDVGKIISNFSWTKDRTNPGGICNITITPDSKLIQDMVNLLNKFSGNLYSRLWGELGVDLEDLFKPMTLCQLWIDGYHVMTGTVTSCQRGASVENDSKNVSYNIIIHELGCIYDSNVVSLDTIIFDGMQTNIVDVDKAAFELVSNIKAVPLDVGISALCTAFLATLFTGGMSASDGLPVSLRMFATKNPLGALSNLSYAQNMIVDTAMFELAGGQSFWGFLKNFIPNPWMELFTESGGRTMVVDTLGVPSILFPGFNYVVARSVPYSNPLIGIVNPFHLSSTLPYDLNALSLMLGGDFIIITDEDIEDKTLGFDSSNQSTVFHTRYSANGGMIPMDNDDKPIHSVGPLNPLASGGVKTFGNRDMFQSIKCTHLFNLGTAMNYVERIAKNKLGFPLTVMSKPALSNLLTVWFRNQSRFREGEVTTRYIPYARPGMYCLYLPSLSGKKPENLRDIGIYYIDSLTHSYSLSNKDVVFNTKLNLIRGVPLPTTIAQSALLLFDYEILPPESGVSGDGEYRILSALRRTI